MTKYLEHVAESNEFTTKGVKYEVLREDARCYYIEIDSGARARYTKEPAGGGESYKTWFKLVEEAESIEAIENVTELTDELGLDREYREVKRKANVGERVKIVAAQGGDIGEYYGYSDGEIHMVISLDGTSDVNIRPDGTEDSEIYLETEEYVVLEASDIIRINGERFRLVERKAAVGERVVITKANSSFSVGRIVVVHTRAEVYDDGIRYLDGEYGTFNGGKYAVLEPVIPASTVEQPMQPSDQQAQIDGLLDTVANLARRLSEVERQLTPTTAVVIPPVTVEAPVNKPLTRDEIIEKAKADVAELVRIGAEVTLDLPKQSPLRNYLYRVDFVINRKKRSVVALVRLKYSKSIKSRGIAKCAPDDVFNVHIGKALALRRALGLEVPEEYVNAPQPTEVKAGDVVTNGQYNGIVYALRPEKRTSGYADLGCAFSDADKGLTFIIDHNSESYEYWDFITHVRILDDSRDGRYGEVYSE